MVSFAVLTTTTMACAGGAFVLDLVGAKASNRGALGSEHMEKVSEGLDRLVAFMGRVPDELEMIHR